MAEPCVSGLMDQPEFFLHSVLKSPRFQTSARRCSHDQLLDKYKSIDVEDYQQLKTQLAELQVDLAVISQRLLDV